MSIVWMIAGKCESKQRQFTEQVAALVIERLVQRDEEKSRQERAIVQAEQIRKEQWQEMVNATIARYAREPGRYADYDRRMRELREAAALK